MPAKHKPPLSLGLLKSPSEDGLSRTWTDRRSRPRMSENRTCKGKPGDQGGWATGNCDVSPPRRRLRSWWSKMSSWWDSSIIPVCTDEHESASRIMFIKSLPHQTNETLYPQCWACLPSAFLKFCLAKSQYWFAEINELVVMQQSFGVSD